MARGAGTRGGAGSGRVGTPGHLAGVPATRAGIRLRRPVLKQLGATPGRLGGLRPQEVDPWTPGLLATGQHTGRLFSGSPQRGSHLRDSSPSSRRTKRWGREAGPKVRGEAWRPRAEPAPASTTLGGWDTLKQCQARQETFRPGKETPKQTAVKRRCPPASALDPLNLPTSSSHYWPQTLLTSPRTGCGDLKSGRRDRSSFPCRRLSLPCQRQPP